MLEVDIPGFGIVKLEYLVSDFSGTLSFDGILLPGLAEQLNTVAQVLQVHILTADTFGKAQDEFKNVHCTV
ncbi:MAG TPA: ATPase P, partial [Thermodesulfobacteriota bacterium]|nr:ATPase P [Thermodesulfobacteriota bacterium]